MQISAEAALFMLSFPFLITVWPLKCHFSASVIDENESIPPPGFFKMLLFVSLQDSVFLSHMNSDSGFLGCCFGELFWVRFVSQWKRYSMNSFRRHINI